MSIVNYGSIGQIPLQVLPGEYIRQDQVDETLVESELQLKELRCERQWQTCAKIGNRVLCCAILVVPCMFYGCSFSSLCTSTTSNAYIAGTQTMLSYECIYGCICCADSLNSVCYLCKQSNLSLSTKISNLFHSNTLCLQMIICHTEENRCRFDSCCDLKPESRLPWIPCFPEAIPSCCGESLDEVLLSKKIQQLRTQQAFITDIRNRLLTGAENRPPLPQSVFDFIITKKSLASELIFLSPPPAIEMTLFMPKPNPKREKLPTSKCCIIGLDALI